MRRTNAFLVSVALGVVLLFASFLDGALRTDAAMPGIGRRADLVATLALTDLALFNEARYTRHPSQADLHSAFQDHPMALDHFPTGSLVPAARPPRIVR